MSESLIKALAAKKSSGSSASRARSRLNERVETSVSTKSSIVLPSIRREINANDQVVLRISDTIKYETPDVASYLSTSDLLCNQLLMESKFDTEASSLLSDIDWLSSEELKDIDQILNC
jgi:hypothetical protein